MAFGHFLLGSLNFMVTALGLWCEVALRVGVEMQKVNMKVVFLNEW
jgi:hypothetical protein